MYNLMKNHLLLCLCASLLTACTSTAPVTKTSAAKPIESVQVSPTNKSTAAVKVVASKSIDAIEYLEFAEAFSNMPIEAQRQSLNSANQALILNPNDLLHRMKLAMIYGLPSSMLADPMKAQQLLQKVLQEGILANSQLAFANVLFDYLVVLNNDGDGFEIEAIEDTRIMIGSGEPINEPIVAHGPFVMNTQTEIMEAFRDYEVGKMGVLIEN